MQAHRYGDPASFLERARGFLLQEEVQNGLFLGMAGRDRSRVASACVAALTARLLDEGLAFCSISADLSNSTTNRIYPAIGYEPVCDMSHIGLSRASEPAD